jgi:hypothetical protein
MLKANSTGEEMNVKDLRRARTERNAADESSRIHWMSSSIISTMRTRINSSLRDSGLVHLTRNLLVASTPRKRERVGWTVMTRTHNSVHQHKFAPEFYDSVNAAGGKLSRS